MRVAAAADAAAPSTQASQTYASNPDAEKPPSPEKAIPPKVQRYAERLLRHYDRNGDGRLQPDEWAKMQGKPQQADASGDRIITLDELVRHIVAYGQRRRFGVGLLAMEPGGELPSTIEPLGTQEVASQGAAAQTSSDGKAPSAAPGASPQPQGDGRSPQDSKFYVAPSRLPAGLPDWFRRRDADGDGQLSLAEFAPKPTQADLEEFARYDRNSDGLITPKEYLAAVKPAKSGSRKAAPGAGGESGEKPSKPRAGP